MNLILHDLYCFEVLSDDTSCGNRILPNARKKNNSVLSTLGEPMLRPV